MRRKKCELYWPSGGTNHQALVNMVMNFWIP